MSTASSPSPSSGRSTPEPSRIPSVTRWGAACAPCATAKAKCLRSSEAPGSKCDRCERLFKNCTKQVHKPRKKRISRPSKTTQIEQRLDRLVNSLRVSSNGLLLSANTLADPSTFTSRTPLVANHSTTLPPGHSDFYTQTHTSPLNVTELADPGPINVPDTYNSFVPPTCICRPEPGEAPGPPDTDENLLKVYRNELAPCFPFVLVPEGVSASTLGAARPFLMAAIRMVSSYRSPKSTKAQMYRLLNHIADHMLLRSERSHDLLMGLVVILGWFHQHCIAHAQLNQLVSLAACLAGELGLKRSPSLPERTRLLVMRPWELQERTNEERRLLLAVWYLSSSISLDINQIDPMRYSAYMQQCLRELQEDGEYKSDMHLIYIVRIQRLCERVSQLRSHVDGEEEAAGIARAPISAYVSGFRAELDKLQANMPAWLQDNVFLKVRMATARLRIHEPPNIDAELLASLSKSLDALTAGSNSALDAFYQSNAALRAWFDAWLSIPLEVAHTTPLWMASDIVYAVMMISRWAWLAARSKMPVNSRPDPVDPSNDNPNVALAAMEAAINPTTPASASTPSSGSNGASPWQTTLPDKDLPQVLAALKAQLSTQPDLMLDVEDYLDRVVTRLRAVDARMAEISIDSGEWRGNIWTLGATKVKIAQLRQQRWSKVLAAEVEEQEQESQAGGGGSENGLGEIEMHENFLASYQMSEWNFNMPWGPNYDGAMPADQQPLWTDMTAADHEWVPTGMHGLGSLGQPPGPTYM